MDEIEEQHFGKPIAVIDSNVMLEIISCVDMVKVYEKEGIDPRGGQATLRRQKARESLLLSVFLNSQKATTYSIFEAMKVAEREVVPGVSEKFENHAMIIWANYVKDNVLPDWVMVCPSNGDEEPTGNRADALLVERAKEYGVPLVSHEGVTVSGVDPKSGIRRKAAAAGVKILTPRQMYGDLDELLGSALFLQRYDNGAPEYARTSPHPDAMRDSMLALRGYYRHILYGVTVGEREPLPVRLP